MIDLTPFCGRDYPTPFSQGDYTYATDLHVLVRVPKVEGVPLDLEAPVWDLAKSLARLDVFTYKSLETSEGHVSSEGREWKVGVAWFSEAYLDKISALPELVVSHAGQLEPMPFRFTGGVGLLMPMKPPLKRAA